MRHKAGPLTPLTPLTLQSAAERASVEAAHPGERWLALQYECMDQGRGEGCLRAALRFIGNGTEALDVASSDATEVARRVFDFLNRTAAYAPLLHVQLSLQGDLTPESQLPGVCPQDGCPQSCESFMNWRPRPITWAALRPHLLAMERWRGAVALTLRTGVADHIGWMSRALKAQPVAGPGARPLASRLEALFMPCPPSASAYHRNRALNATPCVHWRSEKPDAETPSAQLARLHCGGDPHTAALFNASAGPLGAYIDCAARAAQAIADQEGEPHAWGVLLFSDAPAPKCLLEGSHLAAEGHALVTPTTPGHVQYAPAGQLLHAVARATIVDWYLIGLVDVQLPVLGSAFGGSSNIRGKLPRRAPREHKLDAFVRGFEQWFAAGRENDLWLAAPPEDHATLALLGETNAACPVTQRSATDVVGLYADAERAGKLAGR